MINRTNHDVVKIALKWVDKKTVYMWGTFGNSYVTNALIDAKKAQYPVYYTANRMTKLRSMVGNSVTPFDCIGLIKHILWLDENGKVVYASNGMPDTNANGYINMCKGVSTNFDNIAVGEVVWMNGHIGIYAGVIGGQRSVVEATPSWANGVQVTRLSQRNWLKHGKMPTVTYTTAEDTNTIPGGNTMLEVDGSLGPATILALQKHYKMPLRYQDGKISKPSALIKVMQTEMEIPVNGLLDKNTKLGLQKAMGTTQDGIISRDSEVIREIQTRLNNGTFSLARKKPPVVVPKPTPTPPVVETPKKLELNGKMDEATINALKTFLNKQ